jgi:hypothetical protein
MSLFNLHDTLQPKLLKPLPLPLQGVACAKCDKQQACWWADLRNANSDEDKTYVCALCVLYDTRWARESREDIEEVVMEVQRSRRRRVPDFEFQTDESKRLVTVKDANDVLGVITLASRTVEVHRIAEQWKK